MFTVKDHEQSMPDPSERTSVIQSDESRKALMREAAEFYAKILVDLLQLYALVFCTAVEDENQYDSSSFDTNVSEEVEESMDET